MPLLCLPSRAYDISSHRLLTGRPAWKQGMIEALLLADLCHWQQNATSLHTTRDFNSHRRSLIGYNYIIYFMLCAYGEFARYILISGTKNTAFQKALKHYRLTASWMSANYIRWLVSDAWPLPAISDEERWYADATRVAAIMTPRACCRLFHYFTLCHAVIYLSFSKYWAADRAFTLIKSAFTKIIDDDAEYIIVISISLSTSRDATMPAGNIIRRGWVIDQLHASVEEVLTLLALFRFLMLH